MLFRQDWWGYNLFYTCQKVSTGWWATVGVVYLAFYTPSEFCQKIISPRPYCSETFVFLIGLGNDGRRPLDRVIWNIAFPAFAHNFAIFHVCHHHNMMFVMLQWFNHCGCAIAETFCIVLVVALARQEMGQGKKRPQMSPYTGHFCKEPFSADVTPRQTWHLSMAALCEFAFSTFVHCHLIVILVQWMSKLVCVPSQ